jgi:hypothetical protein
MFDMNGIVFVDKWNKFDELNENFVIADKGLNKSM